MSKYNIPMAELCNWNAIEKIGNRCADILILKGVRAARWGLEHLCMGSSAVNSLTHLTWGAIQILLLLCILLCGKG